MLKSIPRGGPANEGQTVVFTLQFFDNTEENVACDIDLMPVLLGNLTKWGRIADTVRMRALHRPLVTSAPYRVAEVVRSAHSDDGKLVAIEVATDQGFPLQIAMYPEQAQRIIELLQREILWAPELSSPDSGQRFAPQQALTVRGSANRLQSEGMTIVYSEQRLKLGSVALAVFWTAAMIWWSGDYQPVPIIIMIVCGTLFGLFWYWAMRRYFRWISRSKT
jgi:hypothetical protein